MVLAASLLVAGWLAGGMTLVLILVAHGGRFQWRLTRLLFAACVGVWVGIAVLGMQMLLT